MTRRLLTLLAVVATFVVAITALAVPSGAASNPVFTVPTGLVTRMDTPLDFSGASVTSPQGEDLAVFITADHGEVVPNGASTPICSANPTPGQLCFYTDPAAVGPLNFRGTESQVNQVMNSLTYTPAPGFPQPANGTLNDTIKFSATEQDIANGLSSGLVPTEVRVEPDNEAPVFAAIPDVLTGVETDVNQDYDFVNDIEVDDPDQYPCDDVTPDERTSTVSTTGAGTLSTSYVAAGFQALGNGTSTIVLTGAIVDINNAYDLMDYHPMQDTSSTDVITVFFDDGGCAGYGGHLTTTGTFPLEVVPGPATHFDVVVPPLAENGTPTAATVTARDANNAVANDYAGMVELTSSDSNADLPPDAPLLAGVAVLPVTFNTDGTQTVTATDTADSSIDGTSNDVLVTTAQQVDHFEVVAPATAVAGTSFDVTVTAKDASNATVTDYAGTVHFSADAAGTVPADATLTNGAGTFPFTFTAAGATTVTATDTADATIDGDDTLTVQAAAADHLDVVGPANATTGSSVDVDVTARDHYGNVATAYAGTVEITSSDANAVLPADSTLTSGGGTFAVTFGTDGNQSVTATDTADPSIDGTSSDIVVSSQPPSAATHFQVAAPATATAGVPIMVTVTALDASNVTATGYSGTVHLTTTDGAAIVGADATLTSGVGTFTVTLRTAGVQSVTAVDTVTSSIDGTSGSITVVPAAPDHLVVAGPATATNGLAAPVTVTAEDAYGNTTPSYAGTVEITSTDGSADLPAAGTLTNGAGVFPVTFNANGSWTVTATDTADGSIDGTSGSIVVSDAPPAPATHLGVTGPADAVAGTPFNVTITALDAADQTASGYSGTVHLTSSDGAAVLPADLTLTNGVAIVSVTFGTAGAQTVTATDTVTPGITGTSASITVTEPAVDPDPEAQVDKSSVEAGGTILVEGSGFQPGESVQVWLHSTPQLLATVVADQAGEVSYLATIPADTPAGTHHIELIGLASAVQVATSTFTVTAAGGPTTTTTAPPAPTTTPTSSPLDVVASRTAATTTSSSGSLPVTGAAIGGLALGGAVLVAAGLVVLAGARRRER